MKKFLLFFLLFSCALNAVNYPPEEKRGVKRHIEEIMQEPEIDQVFNIACQAIQTGNRLLLSQILNAGFNINTTDENGWTLLIHAANLEQVEIVDLLLERNADVNVTDQNNLSALNVAVSVENVPIIQRLLQRRDILLNEPDEEENTPLMNAILVENDEIIDLILTREMIDRGLNINYANEQGETPISQAIHLNNLRALNKLIELGADLQSITKTKKSVLQLAIALERAMALLRLLDIPDIDVNQKNLGKTALMIAASKGDLELARKLLKKGAKIDLQDYLGLTAFDYAKNSMSDNKYKMLVLLRPNLEESK